MPKESSIEFPTPESDTPTARLAAAQAEVQSLQATVVELAIDLNQAHIVGADGTVYQALNAQGKYDDIATRSLYHEAHPALAGPAPDPLLGMRVYRSGGALVPAADALAQYATATQALSDKRIATQAIASRVQEDAEAAAAVASQITAEAVEAGRVQEQAPAPATTFFSATP